MDFLKELERITNKVVSDLTDEEVAFIKARKYYLSAGELEKFKSILEVKVEVEQPKKPTKNSK